MTMHARVAGVWKSITFYARIGGVWKTPNVYARIGGVWKLISSAFAGSSDTDTISGTGASNGAFDDCTPTLTGEVSANGKVKLTGTFSCDLSGATAGSGQASADAQIQVDGGGYTTFATYGPGNVSLDSMGVPILTADFVFNDTATGLTPGGTFEVKMRIKAHQARDVVGAGSMTADGTVV